MECNQNGDCIYGVGDMSVGDMSASNTQVSRHKNIVCIYGVGDMSAKCTRSWFSHLSDMSASNAQVHQTIVLHYGHEIMVLFNGHECERRSIGK